MTDTSFHGLDDRTRRWIRYEQTVNERLIDDRIFSPIDHRSNTVRREFRPERRGVWDQEVVWVPKASARAYGPVADELRAAFAVEIPDGRTAMFLHPQPPAAMRRLARSNGRRLLRLLTCR